jgi:hypothetical protein
MHNLGTVETYRGTNSSYPGCWAYADLLQVGVRNGLKVYETRSHFDGWAIVSSPLILSHDVNNDTPVMETIWDIIPIGKCLPSVRGPCLSVHVKTDW